MALQLEHVRTFDLGELPLTIVTNWAAPLLDGDLPLDCSIDIEPLDLSWAKLQLDSPRNALESSAITPGRLVAIDRLRASGWQRAVSVAADAHECHNCSARA
jgi:hypothetical protein